MLFNVCLTVRIRPIIGKPINRLPIIIIGIGFVVNRLIGIGIGKNFLIIGIEKSDLRPMRG